MQLFVCEKDYCDFFVYHTDPGGDAHVFQQRVIADEEKKKEWDRMKSKLLRFYELDMGPEIVDPIVKLGGVRTPEYRRKPGHSTNED